MYNVKLKDREGNELTYTDIENIKVPTDAGNLALFKSQVAVQEKIVNISKNGTTTVTPDADYDGLSKVTVNTDIPITQPVEVTEQLNMPIGENQIIVPPSNRFMSKVTVTAPSTFIPSNIKKDVNIGGRVGTFIGNQQSVGVALDFTENPQTIKPTLTDYLMNEVTVSKPDTLIPENIKSGINIAQIVGTYTGAESEEVTTNLNMSDGNQVITPSSGKVFSKVTVTKPDTMLPENIKNGINIGGVVGTLVSGGGETEEVTVDLSMADGNQVIMPSAGKSISKATVTKPSTLIPANIKNDVVIGGVTGALDPYASKIAFIANGWSDDDVLCENGFAIARFRQHGVEIQIWADATDTSMPLDTAYQDLFTKSITWGNLKNISLASRLEAFCENLVINDKSSFNSIFTGATKACFMDDMHPIDIPTLTSSTPFTADGFFGVLKDTLSSLPSSFIEYNFMPPSSYGDNLDSGSIQIGSNAFMPFVWYPAVEDGEPKLAYYSLQDPTGTMTTYENGFKMYTVNYAGNNVPLAYVNAVPGVGVTGNFIALIADGIGWWSDVAQTIPAAFLQNMNPTWNGGDVSLVAGWNITTDVGEGTNTTVQMPEEYKVIFRFEPNGIPLSEMDSYEKSVFAGVTKQPYKRLNQNHVSITFVLRNNSQ